MPQRARRVRRALIAAAAPAILLGACAPSLPRVSLAGTGGARDASVAIDAVGTGGAGARDGPRELAPADAGVEAPAPSDAPIDGGETETVRAAGADAAGDGRSDVAPDGVAFSYDGAPPVEPRAGEVVIDELMVNPAGSDTSREWIEIANTTALALDLRELHLADSAKEVAVGAGLLPPGALLVLGQSIDPTKNGGAPVTLAYGGTISLNNDGDTIAICLGPCASGRVLDRVTWDKDLGAAYDGHALVVTPGSGTFCPADQPFGDAASLGTPGTPNPPCPERDASVSD